MTEKDELTQMRSSAKVLPKFRIGTVSRLTGLSADVVRVWERRYAAIQPRRSEGGSRLYSDADISRLRQLRQAVETGHAIGQVARMTDEELARLVLPTRSHPEVVAPLDMQDPHALLREKFLLAVSNLDVIAADLEISRAATLFPPRELVKHIVAPLLAEIGARWAHQEFGVAHEHIASNLIRGLLSSLFRLYPPEPLAESMVLATPQGERHEFGILLVALHALTRGWRVIYLGVDLPATEIARTVKLTKARVLALSLAAPVNLELKQELSQLAQQISPLTRVWIGGSEAPQYKEIIEQAQWVLFSDLDELGDRLKQ